MLLDGSFFFTITNLVLSTTAKRNTALGYDGTWGVWLKNAADVLVTRFNVSAVFTQDISAQVGGGGGYDTGLDEMFSLNPCWPSLL